VTTTVDDPQRRADRRAFIRDHHPDVGGDPDEFIEGLHRLTATPRSTRPTGSHAEQDGVGQQAGGLRDGAPNDPVAPAYAYRSWRLMPIRWLRQTRARWSGTPPRRLD